MKNVNIEQLRIPAYAVVEVTSNRTVELVDNRATARGYLQDYKNLSPGHKFKLVKLIAEKWVR